MFFELNGKTYGVKFSRTGTRTFAEWVEVEEDGINHTGIFGVSSVHHTDKFVRKVGRVVALTNLLKTLSNPDTDYDMVLQKEDRKKIWETYFKSHRK